MRHVVHIHTLNVGLQLYEVWQGRGEAVVKRRIRDACHCLQHVVRQCDSGPTKWLCVFLCMVFLWAICALIGAPVRVPIEALVWALFQASIHTRGREPIGA